ncbi:MAG: 3-deoxy-D-manno-octulosonic acid transferase [Flavobacteriales bacterium]
MRALYTLGIFFLAAGMRMLALFNQKIRLGVQGRRIQRTLWKNYREKHAPQGPVIWFHCSSLGEFEQGRPLIEALRKERPGAHIVLTFFSPSGFTIRNTYDGADAVWYLPFDTPGNVREFVQSVGPDAAIFIKYEYWANYFFELKKRKIPLFVVSGIFRENHRFFGVQRGFWKKVLECVTHFHLQNERSGELLRGIGIERFTVAGDTRYDRVCAIAAEKRTLPIAEAFCEGHRALVVGSSYPAEERIAMDFLSRAEKDWKIMLAPHYTDEGRVQEIQRLCGGDAARWTTWQPEDSNKRVLIVDTIGQLSAIYRYGTMALVGGAFGKGLHNTLEAAVWSIPVAFGPNWEKFDEARELLDRGGAFSGNESQVLEKLERWSRDEALRSLAGEAAGAVVAGGKGAGDVALRLVLNALKD